MSNKYMRDSSWISSMRDRRGGIRRECQDRAKGVVNRGEETIFLSNRSQEQGDAPRITPKGEILTTTLIAQRPEARTGVNIACIKIARKGM